MPEIPDVCEFTAGSDQVRLTTRSNGDQIIIRGIHLGCESAATLAYLINDVDNHLRIEIKRGA